MMLLPGSAIDWSASGLRHKVEVELLDRNRNLLGTLDGVRSLRVEKNMYSTPRHTAQVDLTLRSLVPWGQRLLRPVVEVSYRGITERYPLMTGIPQASGQSRTTGAVRLTPKLFDMTRLLDGVRGRELSLAPGATGTTAIRQMFEEVGVFDGGITESGAVLSTGMYWSSIETRRRIVNDIADAIGYAAVFASPLGQLQCHPYIRPASRPKLADLAHGENCVYRPDFNLEDSGVDVPNHVVLQSRTNGETVPLTSEAWLPADHPYSVETTGLEVPYTEEVDAVDQATLDDLAVQKLLAKTALSQSYNVEWRWIPVELQEAVRFYSPALPGAPEIDVLATIASQSVAYTAGKPLTAVSGRIEEVIAL